MLTLGAISFISGPSAAPWSFTVTVQSSRSLLLSWTPPPEENRGGTIQGYRVDILEVETGTRQQYTTGQSVKRYQATMLHPYYNYQCKVAAYNSAGTGPYTSVVSRTTLEDGKHLIITRYMNVSKCESCGSSSIT